VFGLTQSFRLLHNSAAGQRSGRALGRALQPTREAADRASSVVAVAAIRYLATALLARRRAGRAAGKADRVDRKAAAAENF